MHGGYGGVVVLHLGDQLHIGGNLKLLPVRNSEINKTYNLGSTILVSNTGGSGAWPDLSFTFLISGLMHLNKHLDTS